MNLETMINRYLITAAEVGASPNHKQLDAYERYAEETGAEIIVIPVMGQYPKEQLHKRFSQYKTTSKYSLGKKIEIKDFKTRAQQINPLTQLKRFGAVDKSIIVGSPKQHLEMIANSNRCSPKAIMSTGISTLPNYKDNRIGTMADLDHRQGAIAVEVDSDSNLFLFRQIQNIKDGSFIDSGRKYCADRKPFDVRADTVILGDLHITQMLPEEYEAACEMINTLNPKHVMLHDTFDAYSITHHDMGRQIRRARKSNLGQLSLFDELYRTGEVLHELTSQGHPDTIYHVVKSNHDEHLERYLDEGRYGGDAQNLQLSVKLAAAMMEGKDPLKEGIKLTYGYVPPNLKFLKRDDEFQRYGYQLSSHGDKGPSGSRGSLNAFEYSLGKAFVGHTHSAKIRKDVWGVGTLLTPEVDYAKGSTGSWTATNGVLYPNGKGQLITSFNGIWYL